MAHTARSKSEKKEYFDSEELLDTKVLQLAERLRCAKHVTMFTGAGISTAAGIPDFRSGVDTVLETGPGKWERQATGYKKPPKRSVEMLKAYPTYTHMAIKTLIDHGYVQYLISQNTDGLHLRSGIPKANLSELHGNTNLEKCKKCGQQFLRDYRTRRVGNKVKEHETGRTCERCRKGKLYDSIINFGEELPDDEFHTAAVHTRQADLCIALGSSLTVTPAAGFPEKVGKRQNGDLYIVNLQQTPLDDVATERLNGKCDHVMRKLMHELGLEVQPWRLERAVLITAGDKTLRVSGVSLDANMTPYSVFKQVALSNAKDSSNKQVKRCTTETAPVFKDRILGPYRLDLSFFGHYDEPELQMTAVVPGLYRLSLGFDEPKAWVVTRVEPVMNEAEEQ